jgi:hypothetical protein
MTIAIAAGVQRLLLLPTTSIMVMMMTMMTMAM